jgi:hypothetical protein
MKQAYFHRPDLLGDEFSYFRGELRIVDTIAKRQRVQQRAQRDISFVPFAFSLFPGSFSGPLMEFGMGGDECYPPVGEVGKDPIYTQIEQEYLEQFLKIAGV